MRDLDIHHLIMNNVIIIMYNKYYLAYTSQELKNIDTEHADYDNNMIHFVIHTL